MDYEHVSMLILWVLLLTGVQVTRAQLSDAVSADLRAAYKTLGAPSSTVPPVRPDQHFKLVQTLQAPTLTNPLRQPECLAAADISSLLAENINQQYAPYITGTAVVDTSRVQQVDKCTYSSYISYNGTRQLARLLSQAANSGRFCSNLSKYCAELLESHPEYHLLSTSGTSRAPLPPVLDFNCVKHNFSQRLDHFDSSDKRVFSQVYWVCDDAWPKRHSTQVKKGNIIIFLGNESPLGIPRQPIVFENARRMNALVLLVEHRYYGESVPFPVPTSGTLPTDQYKWLMIEQVIEDTAAVLSHVRQQYKVPGSTPAVVIGGSYGGMISSYHRVVKPHLFAAAISSSAPNNYVFNTLNWERTAERYHQRIAASLLVNSGSAACGETVRQAMDSLRDLSTSAQGRKQLVSMFNICDGDKYLKSDSDGHKFYMSVYDFIAGAVQVNNQPSLLGQVSQICNIMTDGVTKLYKTPLDGLAAANTYYNSNATNNFCVDFKPTYYIISEDLPSYSYQCCTQGTVYSSELPSTGSPGTLIGAFDVSEADLRRECEAMFGKSVPHVKPPSFAINVKSLVRRYGGVVFTNGDVDGWAGGSYFRYKDLLGPAVFEVEADYDTRDADTVASSVTAASSNLNINSSRLDTGIITDGEGESVSSRPSEPLVAFVVYPGASHCTDTHSFNWDNPIEPAGYKRLRARAMDYAIRFMRRRGGKSSIAAD